MSLTRREFVHASLALAGAAASGGCASPSPRSHAVSATEYTRLDAIDLARLIDRGEISASEALEWAIDRASLVDPELNAIVVRDFERARERARGRLPDGPLRGVPFLLKDLWIQLEGTVTTNGSRLFADARAERSNTLAQRYEDAGLVIFGKTASPEFGSRTSTESLLHGDTRNPWAPDLGAGGSSGGAAVAVATGIVPAAHASDGGGSIRIPASCNGIFGLKPSRGRVPTSPNAFDRAAGVNVNHVVSRSVRDSALLLDLTSTPLAGDPYVAPPPSRPYLDEVGRDPGRLRIGLQRENAFAISPDPECVSAAEHAASLCEALGHEIVEIDPAPISEAWLLRAYEVVRGTGIAMTVHARERALGRKATPDDLEHDNWGAFQRSGDYSALDFESERQSLYDIGRQIVQHLQDVDMVLSPTLALLPPEIGVLGPTSPFETSRTAGMAMGAYTITHNVSGQPAMSVPLVWNEAGVPIGVMFAGRPGDEGGLIRLASQLEVAHPWKDRRPPGYA